MSLRSSTEHENGGISLHIVLSSTRHSRARGNPGLFRRISLDTRFRGYDGPRRPLRSHPLTSIFEGEHEGHEGFEYLTLQLRALRVFRGGYSSTVNLEEPQLLRQRPAQPFGQAAAHDPFQFCRRKRFHFFAEQRHDLFVGAR